MKISEICDINKDSISKSDRYETIQYLDTSNLTEGQINCLQEMSCTDAPSRAQRKVQHNTILYSTVRPNQLHYGILKNPEENIIVSTGFVTIDVKPEFADKYDADYLYYLLTQAWVTEYLHTLAENATSSYPSITPSDIGNMSFDFPGIKEQRAVAKLFSEINCKIAVNRTINRNLPLAA